MFILVFATPNSIRCGFFLKTEKHEKRLVEGTRVSEFSEKSTKEREGGGSKGNVAFCILRREWKSKAHARRTDFKSAFLQIGVIETAAQ